MLVFGKHLSSSRLALAALLTALTPPDFLEAQGFIANLGLGANSRGYVSANQVFPGTCGAGSGFGPGGSFPARHFALGNVTLNCSGPNWSGESVMFASARSIRSYTRATADPGFTGTATRNDVVALSRTAYLDTWTISGASPTQAVMTFQLSGALSSSGMVNAADGHTATFGVAWDNDLTPLFPGGVMAPGQYSFSFPITPDMLTRQVYFSIALQTLATIGPAVCCVGNLFSGTSITDYGSTLTMTTVQFLMDNPDGSVTDVTGQVQLLSASGADYLTTLPEPGTVVLLGTGLLLMLGLGFRTRLWAARPS